MAHRPQHPQTPPAHANRASSTPTEGITITTTDNSTSAATDPTLAALHEQYLKTVDLVREASAAYYAGDPAMADEDYDIHMTFLAEFESQHPQLTVADSPTGAVAAGAVGGDVEHVRPMLSLDNVFDSAGFLSWAEGLKTRMGGQLPPLFTVEPKLDGLAIAARYRDGDLVQLLTRGSGTAGEDVSHVIGTLVGLPTKLPEQLSIEIRGEAVMTLEQFDKANVIRAQHGDRLFAKPRNAAAGTVRARDRQYQLPLTFFAYDVLHLDDPQLDFDDSHHGAMAALTALGVNTALSAVFGETLFVTPEDIIERIAEIGEQRPRLPFEIDGAVVKVNGLPLRREAGEGSRAPHWAIAYKYPPISKTTRLRAVEWSVGRTGLIAPTAVLEPIHVDGALVARATLHNPAAIRGLDLRLGDLVSVSKAGDVIPRVEGPVLAARNGTETPIEFPTVCPQCGDELDTSGQRWRCVRGRACGLDAAIQYAVSRDVLDIDGFGPKLAGQLVASGALTDIADLFTLTRAQLMAVDRMGPSTADKLLANIAAAKTRPLSRVLCALGISGTGRSMSRRIAREFGSMQAIQSATAAELIARIEGIGAEKAPVIVAELAELAPVIAKLVAAAVTLTEAGESSGTGGQAGGALTGQVVVVTGSMTGRLSALSRTGVNELIEAAGGKPSGSVSKATTMVVAGEKAGSKLEKATALGIKILTPEEFAELVADHLT